MVWFDFYCFAAVHSVLHPGRHNIPYWICRDFPHLQYAPPGTQCLKFTVLYRQHELFPQSSHSLWHWTYNTVYCASYKSIPTLTSKQRNRKIATIFQSLNFNMGGRRHHLHLSKGNFDVSRTAFINVRLSVLPFPPSCFCTWLEETCRFGSEVVETERLETHLWVLEVCRFPERVEQNLGLEE